MAGAPSLTGAAAYNGAVVSSRRPNPARRALALGVAVLGLALVGAAGARAGAAAPGTPGPIHDTPDLDYQPAIVRFGSTGEMLVVFERLDGSTLSGDLYLTRSADEGATWTDPAPIVASARNERHPALLARADGTLALYYLVDETGNGGFRIHGAFSDDGAAWAEIGALDLGWDTPGEVNPSVVVAPDGTMTMAYHRLHGPAYVARSADGGRTWDTARTQLSPGNAALPRLAVRASDGRYVVTYQTNPGDNDLMLWSRVSHDPYVWTEPPSPLSIITNSHDSQPLVLGDGTFLVLYARQSTSAFDLCSRTSPDGLIWSEEVELTDFPDRYDTQPHGLVLEEPDTIALVWSHQDGCQPYRDHDVWLWSPLAIHRPGTERTLALPFAQGGRRGGETHYDP